jgi:hypothetical protein
MALGGCFGASISVLHAHGVTPWALGPLMAAWIILIAITGMTFDAKKRKERRKVSMRSVTCGCGWTYSGPSPVPVRCFVCGNHLAGGLTYGSSGSGGSGGSGSSGSSGNVTVFGGSGGGSSAAAGGSGGGGSGGSGAQSGNGGIMQRITPRPPGRPASSGMQGFTERGSAEFEFAVGTVRGLRQWNLDPPDFNQDPTRNNWTPLPMKGATGSFLWQAGVNDAGCNRDKSHQAPVDVDENGVSCGCGFWAYWDISGLAAGGAMSINPNYGLPITGLIEGSGRVLVGERGFRSQRAKIIALAPAFSVQAYSPPDYGDPYGRQRLVGEGEPTAMQLARESEHEVAQQRADAWMAVIQDRLGMYYPDAKVYATLKGMLASVVTGEMPG